MPPSWTTCPAPEGIEATLNLFALLDALLLSVTLGAVAWADYDTLMAANERFRTIWSCHPEFGAEHMPDTTISGYSYFSMKVAQEFVWANALLGTGLFVIILTYLSLATCGKEMESATKAQLKTWWFSGGRAMVLFASGATLMGVIYGYRVAWAFLYVLFPDEELESACAANREPDQYHSHSPYGYYRIVFVFFLIPAIMIAFFAAGYAGMAATGATDEPSAAERAQREAATAAAEQIMGEFKEPLGAAGLTLELMRDISDVALLHELDKAGIAKGGDRIRILRVVQMPM